MNTDGLKRMYGSLPQSFEDRVRRALAEGRARKEAAEPARPVFGRRGLRLALIAALVMTLLAAAALAVYYSQVAEYFGRLYGDPKRRELNEGNIAQVADSVRVGDAVYTLDEVTYIDDGLYGVGHISPAGDGVVLMAEDYRTTDPAGYGLYYGEESRAPDGVPTYADLAAQKEAKIVLAKAVPVAVGVDGGDVIELGTVGYSFMPKQDGSILFAFELSTGVAVEEGDEYVIRLWIGNWEVRPDGTWLRDDPALPETYVGQEWDVTVKPKPAAEGRKRW